MTEFDHAQSPRLGQRVSYEGTTVRMFSGAELPEVSVTGQIIYRTDTQGLQVYNGDAWEDVVGGSFGLLTYVGPEPPNAQSVGDLWFDSNDGNHPYRASATGTDNWVSLRDGKIATKRRIFWENEHDTSWLIGGILIPESQPGMTAEDDGDLWYRLNEGNKLYIYNHATTTWEPAPVGLEGIAVPVTTPDSLPDDLEQDLSSTQMVGPTITAGKFQTTTDPNQGIKIDNAGLRAYPPSGGTPFMNVDPTAGMVIVAGEGTFDKLVTTGDVEPGASSAELAGRTDIKSGGEINLNSGAIPPTTAPDVDTTYDTIEFIDWGDNYSDRYGLAWSGTYWFTTIRINGDAYLERWESDGVLGRRVLVTSGRDACGVAVDAANNVAYVLVKTTSEYRVYKYTDISNPTPGQGIVYDSFAFLSSAHLDPSSPVAGIGFSDYWSPTQTILLAQSRDASSNQVRMRTYTWPSSTSQPLTYTGNEWPGNFTYNSGLSGIAYGQFDLGTPRAVFTSRGTGDYRVMNDSGAADTVYDWQSGMTAGKVGFTWTGTEFVSLDKNGVLRTYTELDKARSITNTAYTRWISSTYYRSSGPYETFQSPRASILPSKRSKVVVNAAALPESPGANDPNQVRIYVGEGTTDPGRTNMILQPGPGVGVTTYAYESFLTTPDINPPDDTLPSRTTDFPESVAAKLVGGTKRADGNPKVNIEGSGPTTLDGLLPPGYLGMTAQTSTTPPAGWLYCDGSALNTVTYPDLFAAIGYTYGGSGTSFNLPNFNDRFPIGTHPTGGTKTLGATGGSSTKTIAEGNLPLHTHGGASITVDSSSASGSSASRVARGTTTAAGNITPLGGQTGAGGFANTPMDVMNPYLPIRYMIKT